MTKYRKLSFATEFIDEVENHIKEHPRYGYSSVADFLKSWAREGLRQERRFLRFEPDSKDKESDSPPDKE